MNLGVLIPIVIAVVIAALLDYVQGRIPMPAIIHMIARIVIWVVCLLYILGALGVIHGMPG